jgi:hypothetical protein
VSTASDSLLRNHHLKLVRLFVQPKVLEPRSATHSPETASIRVRTGSWPAFDRRPSSGSLLDWRSAFPALVRIGGRGSFNSTLDIYSTLVYDGFMATSISENATFLRVVVRKDFLKTIQDYRFASRFDSVSDAIRALISHGLLAEGFVKPDDGVPPTAPFPGAAPEIVNGKLVGWSLEL